MVGCCKKAEVVMNCFNKDNAPGFYFSVVTLTEALHIVQPQRNLWTEYVAIQTGTNTLRLLWKTGITFKLTINHIAWKGLMQILQYFLFFLSIQIHIKSLFFLLSTAQTQNMPCLRNSICIVHSKNKSQIICMWYQIQVCWVKFRSSWSQ